MEYMLMPLKRYAEFSGRSTRMEFWMFVLLQVLIGAAILLLFLVVAGSAIAAAGNGSAGGLMAAGGSAMILLALAGLIGLALFIPMLAVSMRRLHDTGRSGWWVGGFYILYFVWRLLGRGTPAVSTILGLAVLAYAIVLIVFYCLEGTKGPNQYGADPKGQVDAQVFA